MTPDQDEPRPSDHEKAAEEIVAECAELKRRLQEVFDGLRAGSVRPDEARKASQATEERIAVLIAELEKMLPEKK